MEGTLKYEPPVHETVTSGKLAAVAHGDAKKCSSLKPNDRKSLMEVLCSALETSVRMSCY